MAPTILVARIALKNADTEQTVTATAPHITELGLSSPPFAAEQINKENGCISIQMRDDFLGGNQGEVGTAGSGVPRVETTEKV